MHIARSSAPQVSLWGPWDQTSADMRRLHHHEPRLRWTNRATWQPEGPVQTHRHDGAQLCSHCWGDRFPARVRLPAVFSLHLTVPFFLALCLCRWSCTLRDLSPVRSSPGRWRRCISCARSSCPSRTITTLAWEQSSLSWWWQGQSITLTHIHTHCAFDVRFVNTPLLKRLAVATSEKLLGVMLSKCKKHLFTAYFNNEQVNKHIDLQKKRKKNKIHGQHPYKSPSWHHTPLVAQKILKI